MTETGKNEDTAELPLEGSPDRKNSKTVEPPSPDQGSVQSDVEESSPVSNVSLPKTPTTSRLSDASVFKTPDPITPTSSAKKRKRLTPEEKSLREKERQDKRRKLEEEKQKKEAERLEKARQKEAERLKKEEERRRSEEEKRLERLKKEEERKKIEEERKQERLKKEEERRKVDEEKKLEKLKKDEEKKRKDDEKRQKEEEKERERMKLEEKKQKQAQFFTNFFQKPSASKVHTIENGDVKTTIIRPNKHVGVPAGAVAAASSKNSANFNPLPFQIKTDMAVAPLCRRVKLSEKEKQVLEAYLSENSTCSDAPVDISSAWFNSIKRGKGRKYGRTEIFVKDSPEIQVLDKETSKPIGCRRWRMKLLQFEENRRPAYWGTWMRKARKVKARKPLARETEVDYDFDSDDEWEDEPEDGEEIENSGDEAEDREEGDDEEDEEGWMVPHGYLSDSEREGMDGGDFEVLKCKEKEFYKSLKEKTMTNIPFIVTEHLACYRMRLCPVFKSANVSKTPAKRKPRAPRKKKPEEIIKTTMPPPPAPVSPAPPTPPSPKTTPAVLTTSSPKQETTSMRKSERKRKIVEEKPNPYAKPPSGFLGMELPSDDEEEDMDWEDQENSSSSGSDSGSDVENDEGSTTSDSDEDLFIPVVRTKPNN